MSLRIEHPSLKIRSAAWSIRQGNLPQALNCLLVADSESCLQRVFLARALELLRLVQPQCTLDIQVEIEQLLEATKEPVSRRKKRR